MSSSTKFRVSSKEPEPFEEHEPAHKLDGQILSLFTNSKQYREHYCTEVLQGSNLPTKSRLVSNGFVDTVVKCYNNHHNLVLRPDDVWTAIMVQFSFYVNANAEKFRGKFVSFEGKKELTVCAQGRLRSAPYDLLTKLMSKEIDKNLTDPEVKGWVLPSFSTTTDNDLVTCGVVFMATMKEYFTYKMCLLCGIPYVTLEGSVKDWEDILGRLEKLKEYELGWWYDLLEPICQQFVKSKKGKPDIDFWEKVCSSHGGGSGPTYLSGWITAFCVFNEKGRKQGSYDGVEIWGTLEESEGPWPIIDTNDIPSGTVEVNVKIDDNGAPFNSVMFAGHLAQEILDDGFTLKPTSGWIICLTPSEEEIKKIEAANPDCGRYRRGY